ncbi:hypothetical protein QR685DRAFT_193071 [Neurospora intermedia]|uniref:Questionable protein n=1 Tax=Neurospora intermedia TaxID=5142 RepID=A0ABR3DN17_NEUIN
MISKHECGSLASPSRPAINLAMHAVSTSSERSKEILATLRCCKSCRTSCCQVAVWVTQSLCRIAGQRSVQRCLDFGTFGYAGQRSPLFCPAMLACAAMWPRMTASLSVQDRKFISTFGRRTCQRTRTTNRIDINIPGWPSLAWNQHAYPTQSEAEATPSFGPIRTPLNNE